MVQWVHLRKNLGVIFWEYLQMYPQAEQESILGQFLEDLEGRSGSFSSFSLCFEGDD